MKRFLFILAIFSTVYSHAQNVVGQQFGRDAAGNVIAQPIGSKADFTTTPLRANASWTSRIFYYNGNNNIQLAIQANVPGLYSVEYFTKDSVKIPFMGSPTLYDPSIVKAFQAAIAAKGDGVRIVYTNGSIAQDSLYIEVGLLNTPIQQTLRSAGTTISATNLAGVSHVMIEGKDSTVGGVPYRQATTSTVGKKVGIDVNVINRTNDTQKVVVTNPSNVSIPNNLSVTVANPDTSVSVKSLPSIPAGTNTIGSVNINGTVPISGSVNANVLFPASQAVTGTVAVSNFDTSVSVTSLPPIPAGNNNIGSVNVTNPYSVLSSDSSKYRKVISIDNFPDSNQSRKSVIATIANPTTSINISNPYTVSASDSLKYRKVVSVDNFVPLDSLKSRKVHSIDNFPSSFSVSNQYSVTASDSSKYRKVLSVDNFPNTFSVSNQYSVLASDSSKYRKIHSIDNFPSSFSVSNPYSVTASDSIKYRKVVSIDNFPQIQQVAGTVTANADSTKQRSAVTVLNQYSVLASDSIKYRSTINIGNQPNVNVVGFDSTKTRVVQNITGNVSATISGVPTVNANVSGTVNVDSLKQRSVLSISNQYSVLASDSSKYRSTINIGNTPNVSVTGFDSTKTRSVQLLSQGAATSALQTSGNTSLATIASNGSTSALQATGNTSLNNIDLDLGSLTDAAVINAASSGSVIALLKGFIATQAGYSTTASQTVVNASTTGVQALAANANRKKVIITNTTSIAVSIYYGTATTARVATLASIGQYWEMPDYYKGIITVKSSSGTPSLEIVETTP
jgi:hypothetical protein